MSEQRLIQAAARRHGVFTRAEARAESLTDRQIDYRIRTGRWSSLHPGVYCVTGTPVTWPCGLVAACAAVSAPSLASHRSAGRLWGFPNFDSAPIEISVAPGRGRALHGAIVHQCAQLLPEDQRLVDCVPVTGPELTLVHLAGAMSPRRIEGLVDHALRQGLTTEAQLRARLFALARSGRNGIGILRSVLDARAEDAAPHAESSLERAFLRLVARNDLPRPRVQHVVRDRSGRFIARLDTAWPNARLAVELDGRAFHAPLHRWNDDLARQNALVTLGWTVLRFTWWDIHDRPHQALRQLEQTLARDVSAFCAR